ncbi:hypothetical protein C8Q79DRAFT_1008503 [Trametes meyenii]|nr:hypothetical protein C8Q79DRAFT_1008503 [Trametes meyenii]
MPTLLQQVRSRAREAALLGKRLLAPKVGHRENIREGYYLVGRDSAMRFSTHIMVEQSSIVSYDVVPPTSATQCLDTVSNASASRELEEECDDIDPYYFSACSDDEEPCPDSTIPVAEAADPEDDEQMPGGWPAVYVTVTAADSDYEVDIVPEVRWCPTAQLLDAMESVSENMGGILTPCTDADGFLCVPRVGPSPSVLVVLEEFANSPSARWAHDGAADLCSFSRSPSSANLLVPPECCPVTSPEFASNFVRTGHLTAAASHSALALGTSYYPLNSILEQYVGDDEDCAEMLCSAAPSELLLPQQPITPCDTALNFFDSYFNLSRNNSEEDGDIASDSDATCVSSERDRDTSAHEVVPTFESKPSSHEPFDELWRLALEAEAFVKRVVDGICSEYEPQPDPDHPPEPVSGDQAFTEETFWTPATSRLFDAADPHREGLVQDAHAAFWANWARPSDADLASIFERRDDSAPSGLLIFMEEGGCMRPLPGNDSSYIPQALATRAREARERSMRRKLEREERDRIRQAARKRLKQHARTQFLDRWHFALDLPY